MIGRCILAALLAIALLSPLGRLARAQNAAPTVQVPLQDLPVVVTLTEQVSRWFSELRDT